MKKLDFKGRLVVVTGASSGLGHAIARALALGEHANVVVAARRCDRLEGLKEQIEKQCSSRVYPLPVDLSAADGAATLFQKATEIGEVSALVNCAGLTYFGRALDAPRERNTQIVNVNFAAAMNASLFFLEYFLKRGEGVLLNVTSGASLVPWPYQTVYSATKHAMRAFTEALAWEYRGRGVRICSFAPGGVDTDLIKGAGIDKTPAGAKQFLMSPETAAALAVRAMKRGKASSIPGFMNRAGLWLARVLPRRLIFALISKAYAL
jgi:uncharacterized protein